MSKLILDCVLYNGEPIMVFRLHYLAPVVDKFIIVESRMTHAGKKKPVLYIDKYRHIFQPYMDKVIFKVIESLPNEQDTTDPVIHRILKSTHTFRIHEKSWLRETYHRDFIQEFLLDTFENQRFLVLVCDVDEIPNRNQIPRLQTLYDHCHDGIHFQTMFLRYNFHWKEPNMWVHPFVVSDQGTRNRSFSDMRLDPQRVLENSGWHLSYFLTLDDMVRKLESFAHTEFNQPKYKRKEYIKTCILTGRYIFDKKHKLLPTFGENLPEGWKEFQAKLNDDFFESELGEYST